jgi:hypothetical protein
MSKERLIQVQKPAQSLDHFTKQLAEGAHTGSLLKPLLIGAGVVFGLALAYGVYDLISTRNLERFDGQLAQLLQEVEGGDPAKVPVPAEVQQRMKERLSRLEGLAKDAPSSRRPMAQGLVASWKLALDGQGAAPGEGGPWSRVQAAQRALALGQAAEAQKQLAGLDRKADPSEPWAEAFWTAQMEADVMAGAKDQAKAHAAAYRERFKAAASAAVLKQAEQL